LAAARYDFRRRRCRAARRRLRRAGDANVLPPPLSASPPNSAAVFTLKIDYAMIIAAALSRLTFRRRRRQIAGLTMITGTDASREPPCNASPLRRCRHAAASAV